MTILATAAEVWKLIPGCEDYRVSNLGRIQRMTTKRGVSAGHMLTGTPGSDRRVRIRLVRPDGRYRGSYQVHRLVMLAFVGPCPDGMEVNHKDGDPTNNRLDNLEYCTPGDNQRHAYAMGLRSQHNRNYKGEQVYNAKLTEAQVREVFSMKGTMTPIAIGRKYGVADGTIRDILLGKTWKHMKLLEN